MELGEYYEQNLVRIASLDERDWKIALKKCKDHIKWKLKQKTLSGAHSASRLGADAVDHYLGVSYEKILSGEWEWKAEFSLVEQMIRIADSYISAEVEKKKTKKEESCKIGYRDVELEFYDLVEPLDTLEEEYIFAEKLKRIEDAIDGDPELELFMDAVKAGMKRAEVASMLDLQPRQLDKVRERLFRKVRIYNSSKK